MLVYSGSVPKAAAPSWLSPRRHESGLLARGLGTGGQARRCPPEDCAIDCTCCLAADRAWWVQRFALWMCGFTSGVSWRGRFWPAPPVFVVNSIDVRHTLSLASARVWAWNLFWLLFDWLSRSAGW